MATSMRRFLKNLWLNAAFAMKALMSLVSVILFSSSKVATSLRKLASTTDISNKVFVLGNGPSLNSVLESPKLMKELHESDVIVTNRFATSAYFYKLKPKYYILLDPFFFDIKSIEQDPTALAMYEALNKVHWPMILFLSKNADQVSISHYLNNPKIKIVLYNATQIVGPTFFQNFMYRNGFGLPNSRNVILPAITLMINQGYKEIYLYGAEFSWTKNIDVNPENNKIFINDGHFYQNKNETYMPVGWYRWYLDNINQMLHGTEQLSNYARSKGIKVVNRTKGSFIDAFNYENPDYI